jgi:hypothetical protein
MPTPAPPVSGAAAYYPRGTFTGIPAVDKFLRVVYSGDLTSLADDAVFQSIPGLPATTVMGGPICPPGAADGTPVQAMAYTSCDVNFVFTRAELRQRLPRSGAEVLYAVYEGGSYGAFGVAIVTPFNLYPTAFYLDQEGRLTGVIHCGGPRGQNPEAKLLFPPRGS